MILSSKYPYFSFTIVHFIMQLYEIISHAKLIPFFPGSLSFQTLYYSWHKIYYHISHIKKKFLLRIHSHPRISNFSAPIHLKTPWKWGLNSLHPILIFLFSLEFILTPITSLQFILSRSPVISILSNSMASPFIFLPTQKWQWTCWNMCLSLYTLYSSLNS